MKKAKRIVPISGLAPFQLAPFPESVAPMISAMRTIFFLFFLAVRCVCEALSNVLLNRKPTLRRKCIDFVDCVTFNHPRFCFYSGQW